MSNALESNGWRWAQLRAAMAVTLADAGALPCWRCGRPVVNGQAWALGHVVDRALGGQDEDGLAIEHKRCSDQSGAVLGNALRAHRSRESIIRAPRGELWS